MPWTDALDFSTASARIRRDDLLATAIAARAAQAETRAWRAWVRECTRDA